jgi:hypothetical protein
MVAKEGYAGVFTQLQDHVLEKTTFRAAAVDGVLMVLTVYKN